MRTYKLTNTHVRVLRFIVKGLSEKLIGIELGISKRESVNQPFRDPLKGW